MLYVVLNLHPQSNEEMVVALRKMFIFVFLPECKTLSILSQLTSISVRTSSHQHHGESTQVIVFQHPHRVSLHLCVTSLRVRAAVLKLPAHIVS